MIETLAALMRNGDDERVRGTSAQALLDRGWGKRKVEVVSDESAFVHRSCRRKDKWTE